MTKREVLFAAVLVTAGGLVVHGVSLIAAPAAWIVGGILLAGIAWLVLGEA